jgi:hypothetical protein
MLRVSLLRSSTAGSREYFACGEGLGGDSESPGKEADGPYPEDLPYVFVNKATDELLWEPIQSYPSRSLSEACNSAYEMVAD